ncbi:hypothetical protein GSI_03997 [Ganoderma sinense ZZ0214-1]|uniref:Uncharacterized protein n=1 Tax=Ganoderma sinense ZZ0214-1 TaxID=1077348 RepID=A0A2G8SI30_9APHY|nr:hypothetical protein GSI_03997 [Ganoderma sinense ZZ0214-1]
MTPASTSADSASSHEAVPDDVCGRFRRLVRTDASLQYKVELVKSGMVDGPAGPGTLGTGDRLDHLRAYSARLRNGEYTSVQDCSVDSDPDQDGERKAERVWSTGASVAYVARKAGRRELVLSMPPVSRVGGGQRRNVVVALDDFGQDALVATDYTQDLLVGVSRHIDDCSNFQIRIGSLNSGRLGHPMARDALLQTSAFDIYVQHAPADVEALRIYSQYIFLVVFVDQMGPYDFQIWNWMTGTLLMKTVVVSMGTPRFTLIDNEHFAVIGSRDSEISIYRITPDAGSMTVATPEARLVLPGASVRRSPNTPPVFFFIHEISVSLPISPSTHDSATREPFTMNPDSAVLFINLATATGLEARNYVLLVPMSSLRASMEYVYGSSESQQSLGWDEWGSGALLLHSRGLEGADSRIYPSRHWRPYGSRMPVLVYPQGPDGAISKLLIIEMDPSAVKYSRGMGDMEERGQAEGAVASLRKHVQLDLHGHQLRPNYTVYPGPTLSLTRRFKGDEIVLDEHSASISFGDSPGEHWHENAIYGFQTWVLG